MRAKVPLIGGVLAVPLLAAVPTSHATASLQVVARKDG